MASYTRVFTNPYPNGWENLPSTRTPIIAQALQQHTNAIINIENYLSLCGIPTKTSDLINDSVPTKLSELINDEGFITDADVPTAVSDLDNDLNFITLEDIPQNLSDYNNDMEYVTSSVNNLLNYFLKSETYSKSEIQTLLANLLNGINNWNFQIVQSLPTENISETTVYCVLKGTTEIDSANAFDLNLENERVQSEEVLDINIGDPIMEIEDMGYPYGGT